MAKLDSSEASIVVAGVMVGGLAILLIAAVIATYGVLVSGYVLSILWGWFITPVFGVVAPSVLACAGLAMFTGFLSGNTIRTALSSTSASVEKGSPVAKLFAVLISPWMVLFTGWVIHSFM